MKIVICASMSFSKQIIEVEKSLIQMWHQCVIPHNASLYANWQLPTESEIESTHNKIKDDLIRWYYNLIGKNDAILVLNYDKNWVKGYIWWNTFLEMWFAYVLNKKIYLLNPIPILPYSSEILAFEPIVIHNDFNQIN